MKKNIDISHNKPSLGKDELLSAKKTIKSGWIAQGTEVRFFEDEICNFLGLPKEHAVCVSSGTAALYLALFAIGASKKKIAIPAYTCSSLKNAIRLIGGKEVFIDSQKGSPNIDIVHLQKSKYDYAIIPHMYGIPIDLQGINNKNIIEDCAQALGAKINGQFVGLKGELGILSFYATKLITSGGQGGMVISKNKALIDIIRDYREFDQRRDKKNRFNFQITDIQASIGRTQLKKIKYFLHRREIIFNRYKDAGLDLLDNNEVGVKPIRYRAIWKTNNTHEKINKLAKLGIKTIIPLEEWELLEKKELCPNAHVFTQSTVSLPIYPDLTDNELEYIITQVSSLS